MDVSLVFKWGNNSKPPAFYGVDIGVFQQNIHNFFTDPAHSHVGMDHLVFKSSRQKIWLQNSNKILCSMMPYNFKTKWAPSLPSHLPLTKQDAQNQGAAARSGDHQRGWAATSNQPHLFDQAKTYFKVINKQTFCSVLKTYKMFAFCSNTKNESQEKVFVIQVLLSPMQAFSFSILSRLCSWSYT